MMKISRYSLKSVPFSILCLILLCFARDIDAQIVRHPDDTGRIKWGHSDLGPYTRPSMCDRAVAQTWLYNTRKYVPDTVMTPLRVDDSLVTHIPKEVIQMAKACGGRFAVETSDADQLWSMARIAIAAQDFLGSQAAVDRLLQLSERRADTVRVLNNAYRMYLNVKPLKLDIVHRYIKAIDDLSPAVPGAQYGARLALARFWFEHYDPDSVKTYASQAIEIFKSFSFDEQERIPAAHQSFQYLFDIANEAGDIAAMDEVIDSAEAIIGQYGGGIGQRWISHATRILDFRKSLYGNMSRPLEGSYWFNNNGIARPVPGKISLVVLTNHNGGERQYSQYTALKRLHRIYGDKLDVTLITTTQGYAPGASKVLTPEEEGAEAAKYFNDFHRMPFSVVVDEAPTHRLDDGRIIRGPAPLAGLFMDWQGVNAFLTDAEGRIQWAGMLTAERDRRLIMSTINRLLEEEAEN